MKNRLLAIAALLGTMVLVSGVFAPSASAHHAVPTLKATDNGDGTATITATRNSETDHQVPVSLVVDDGTNVTVEELSLDKASLSINVGPYAETTTIYYRIFGGEERNYDVPLWNGHPDGGVFDEDSGTNLIDEINAFDNKNGTGFAWTTEGFDATSNNPFIQWEEIQLTGQETGDSGVTATPVCDTLESLTVAEEQDRDGYDRELFGTYDRDALLAASADQNGGMYYSVFDDEYYSDASEVDVDHVVALAEAWDSGIDPADMEAYGGDTTNLVLLTDNVNQSKGDGDAAEWQPTHNIDQYLDIYLATKKKYDLSVDEVELDALKNLIFEVDQDAPCAKQTETGGTTDNDDENLPVTGSNLILLIIVGMASATLGTIAVVIGRRKGVV